jgi:large subunit ribosomal protein L15
MSLIQSLTKIVEKSRKRVGRGPGSGKGRHTAGRGTKGQRARKSGEAPAWFEGGQLPLVKRMPMMRGKARFNVLHPTAAVSLSDLEKMKADVITLDTLKIEKVIDKEFKKAKVIANGSLTRKVMVKGLPVSQTAAKMIQQAGGSIEAANS